MPSMRWFRDSLPGHARLLHDLKAALAERLELIEFRLRLAGVGSLRLDA
jgi:hypothetical protein